MTIEGAETTKPLMPGERARGLQYIAELRAKVFRLNPEPEIERFLSDMRNKRDINYSENIRTLSAVFFMARIPAERHGLTLSELTSDEKKNLINAMGHFRAMVSVFPRSIALPN